MRLCMVGCGGIADRHAAAIRVVNAEAAVVRQAEPAIFVTATVDPNKQAAQRLAAGTAVALL